MPRNYRKVPEFIWEEVRRINADSVVVACSKQVPLIDIASGKWQHVGVRVAPNSIACDLETLPDQNQGKYSRRNQVGHTVVRKDLPKVSRPFSFEVPNFGDWSKGSHEVTIYRDVYPREFHAPRELTISPEVLREDREAAVIKFTVNEALSPRAADFGEALLFNINLLQENVGSIGLFRSNASVEEYLQTVHVDWELLPVGSRDTVLERLLSTSRQNTDELRRRLDARRRLLESFHPTSWLVGTSGLRRYFGAQFRPDLVVFENVDYGNAVYVLVGDWASLSKMSRIELMERVDGVIRIVHRAGWELKLRRVLEDNLGPLDRRQAA